jgi:hypothetical protein
MSRKLALVEAAGGRPVAKIIVSNRLTTSSLENQPSWRFSENRQRSDTKSDTRQLSGGELPPTRVLQQR